jgi:hypothetical protein
MEQYVSYHKIIQNLEYYQQSQVGINLNSFGHGNIYEFSMNASGGTAVYPLMFVSPQNVSYDMNTTTYTLQILFADRINDDMSNQVDVISDMSIQAKRFISFIQRGMNQDPPLFDIMDNIMPVTAIPFLERFNDYVGGVSMDISITIFEYIDACDYYDLEPEPTPTITPTNTTTPTNTPTITPSSTPNPLCPSQMIISSGIGSPSLFPRGTYNRLSVYSGGSFTAAYALDNSNVITFGATPDGKNYATYGFITGTTYYQYIAQINNSTSAFINWICIQSNNNYVFNGGTQVSKGYAVSSGAANNTLFDGSIYYPATGLSNFGSSNSIYISYPISCPTPTITPTNTGTPTPTPTDSRACRTYTAEIYGYNFAINYVDCSGNTQSQVLDWGTPITICAKQNSVYSTPSGATITDIGTCP